MPASSTWAMVSSRKERTSNLRNGYVPIRRVRSVVLILVVIGCSQIKTCVTGAPQNASLNPPPSKIPNGPSKLLETVALEEGEVQREGEKEEEELQELQNRVLTKSCGNCVKRSSSKVNVKPTVKSRRKSTDSRKAQSQ